MESNASNKEIYHYIIELPEESNFSRPACPDDDPDGDPTPTLSKHDPDYGTSFESSLKRAHRLRAWTFRILHDAISDPYGKHLSKLLEKLRGG